MFTDPAAERADLLASDLRRLVGSGVLVPVPVDALNDLLTAWSALTAHAGRDAVPPEGDAAYDVLNDYLADVLS